MNAVRLRCLLAISACAVTESFDHHNHHCYGRFPVRGVVRQPIHCNGEHTRTIAEAPLLKRPRVLLWNSAPEFDVSEDEGEETILRASFPVFICAFH